MTSSTGASGTHISHAPTRSNDNEGATGEGCDRYSSTVRQTEEPTATGPGSTTALAAIGRNEFTRTSADSPPLRELTVTTAPGLSRAAQCGGRPPRLCLDCTGHISSQAGFTGTPGNAGVALSNGPHTAQSRGVERIRRALRTTKAIPQPR